MSEEKMKEQDIPWETVSTCGGTLYRMKVDGGYLYLKTSLLGSDSSMIFVPDKTEDYISHNQGYLKGHEKSNQEILEMIGDLSIKLNNMQDSLREFEKEKIKPLEEYVIMTEKTFNWFRRERDLILERIHKLEEHHTRQIDENRKVSKTIELINDTIANINIAITNYRGRIENLESTLNRLTNVNVPYIQKLPSCIHGITKGCMVCDKGYTLTDSPKRECDHDFGCSLLLSDPPKQKCDKCGMLFDVEFEAPSSHPRDEVKECQHEWETNLGLLLRKCKKCDETGHPRDTLQLCPHGMPVKFNTVINCAFCNAISCGSVTLK